ncbi:DUF2971 domain-containing protein [bacterium SCSIO 12643]|nr:DUF2971 domain-containing protein [bacterium SCSIO 12643]
MKENYEKEPSNSLYHFTNFKVALEHILPNFELRLNSIVNTNDPREYKSFGFGAINGKFSSGKEIREHQEWDSKATNLIRKGVKVLCFSQDYKIDEEWFDGYNLPRMWAHYGHNHTGVCFEIDKNIFMDENSDRLKNTFLKAIDYVYKFDYPWIYYDRLKEVGEERYFNEFKKANMDYLFFKKFVDWEAERETRLLKFSTESDLDEYVSIKKSIKRIIIGCEFNLVYLPSLIKLSDGIKIEKIAYSNEGFKSFPFSDEYIENTMKVY